MGMVKFWDAVTCTQLQTFTPHGADVLCLAINPGNNAVYTSGVDQKVTEFLAVEVSTSKQGSISSGSQRRWIQSCTRRLHSHDVRALGTWPPHSLFPSVSSASTTKPHVKRISPILVSAGLDMSLIFTPCTTPGPEASHSQLINPFVKSGACTFEESYYYRAPFTTAVTCIAPNARLLASRYDNQVAVWRIKQSPTELVDFGGESMSLDREDVGGWSKVLEMQLKVGTNISAIALSPNGRWLAVSDLHEVKLFSLVQVSKSALFLVI